MRHLRGTGKSIILKHRAIIVIISQFSRIHISYQDLIAFCVTHFKVCLSMRSIECCVLLASRAQAGPFSRGDSSPFKARIFVGQRCCFCCQAAPVEVTLYCRLYWSHWSVCLVLYWIELSGQTLCFSAFPSVIVVPLNTGSANHFYETFMIRG